MSPVPSAIRAHREQHEFELQWSDGTVSRLPFKYVRGECPCASCIEEWTGRRLLDLNSISDDIEPTSARIVGNYALKIVWNDGHDTGLYPWDLLYRISQADNPPPPGQ